jgi:hypothetical protein
MLFSETVRDRKVPPAKRKNKVRPPWFFFILLCYVVDPGPDPELRWSDLELEQRGFKLLKQSNPGAASC